MDPTAHVLLSQNTIMWFNPCIFNCEYCGILSRGDVTVAYEKKWLPVIPNIRIPPGTGSQYHIGTCIQCRYLPLGHLTQ